MYKVGHFFETRTNIYFRTIFNFCIIVFKEEEEVVNELEEYSLSRGRPQPAQHRLTKQSGKKKKQGPRMSVDERDRLARKKQAAEHLKDLEDKKKTKKVRKKGKRIKFG